MATATLVDKDVEIGRNILHELVKSHIQVSVAFWAHVPQISEWQLFIATPLVDSHGPKYAYDKVLRALHAAGMNQYLPWRRIFLRSPKDPILRSLEKQKESPSGSIDIAKSGNIPKGSASAYYVTYAPCPSETFRVLNEPVGDRFVEDAYLYGKTWHARGLDDLRDLLLKFLHLNRDLVDSAIEDLEVRKKASIPNVHLHPRDLRRLRTA